jgi:hypothetical protein
MAQGSFSRAEQPMVIASEAKQSACSVPQGTVLGGASQRSNPLQTKRLLRQKTPRNDCNFNPNRVFATTINPIAHRYKRIIYDDGQSRFLPYAYGAHTITPFFPFSKISIA